jgi:hypothetical protein
MSRQSIPIAFVLLLAAIPIAGQINLPPGSGVPNTVFGTSSPGFSNGPELFNGDDGIVYYFGCPSIGNIPGQVPPVVNLTPPDQRFFVILPRELMHSGNGTPPNPGATTAVPPGYTGGTMEFVGQQVAIFYSYWNNPSGTLPVMWDQTFDTVTYPDGAPPALSRRFPAYATPVPVTGASNAFLTVSGGPIALPPPLGIPTSGCTSSNGIYGYTLQIDYAYTAPGGGGPPGINIPADGNTDVGVTLWAPGGMALGTAAGGPTCLGTADPTNCETGGNYTFMALASTCAAPCTFPSPTTNHEHVALGLNPTNRNPYGGWVGGAGIVNNWAVSDSWMNQIGFREPFVQFNYNPYNAATSTFWGPERGAGSLNMDATGLAQVQPGMRMQCTPCLGQLVLYVFQSDPVNYNFFQQPGLAVTPTANLILNPADPNFFLITPMLDSIAVNTVGQYVVNKHTADTPLIFTMFGPQAVPVDFWIQGFVIDTSVTPFGARSSNVAKGQIR